ncbi:MAG: DNA-directed RNA polymerase subunit beta' [Firmicutes bacterium]|nr:DNA-directed RNA polymerase subunit beta' [Bacillota bacterium]
MFELNNFDSIQIGVASPEKIREWSYGEVTKPETINYRTQKPERDGLFCERIFGPTKDWECHCGKYKRIRYKGVVCDKCGVEVTRAKVRRDRMGHIELAAPVSHIWYFRGVPSRMGLLLDMSPKALEQVLYFVNYIVLDPKDTNFVYKQIISDREYREAIEQFGPKSFKAGMGAEVIKELLQAINLDKEYAAMKKIIDDSTGQKKLRATKRIDIIQSFRKSGNRPEWMVLDVLPVIPPELRPMVQLDGGRFATSDLNDLYRRVINRNNRLKRLIELGAPDIIVRNEKRMLQEAVDALIDNGRRGKPIAGPGNRELKSLSGMLRGKQGRFRQNLLGKRVDYSGRSVIVVGPELKLYQCGLPKEMALELFKPFVMKKLVEQNTSHNIKSAKRTVERANPKVWDVLEEVISDHPVLLNRAPTLHRLSIQAFEPVLIEGRALKIHPLVCSAFNADFDGDQMAVHVPLSIEAQSEARFLMLATNNILKLSDGRPVVSPTQDMVIGSYYLTILKSEGKGAGKYFKDKEEAIMAYQTKQLDLQVPINVRFSGKIDGEVYSKMIKTSVGRILFNESIPQDLGFKKRETLEEELDLEIDFLVGKKELQKIVESCFKQKGATKTAEMLDKIKNMGFKYSTLGAITTSVFDMHIPPNKKVYINDAEKKVLDIEKKYNRGFTTSEERYKSIVRVWTEATENVTSALVGGKFSFDDAELIKNLVAAEDIKNPADSSVIVKKGEVISEKHVNLINTINAKADITKQILTIKVEPMLNEFNPVWMMANSGARGNKNQIRQLSGMRGLMSNPSGKIIEVPVRACFREGLTVLEYFISSHGGRKGLADTALKTADSGYLTRRLVDVSQEVIVREEDCFSNLSETPKGMPVSAITGENQKEIIESLFDRLVGRFATNDVVNPKTNEVYVKAGEMITEVSAKSIVDAGINSVNIRTVLTCKAKNGICAKCYGKNMATGQPVQIGESVGIIAAQSIGEPGTQLTMRTFHTGGVASSDDITQGLPRVEELFEARKPKGVAIVCEYTGVADITETNGAKKVIVKTEDGKAQEYIIPFGARLKIKQGDVLEPGSVITEGSINPHDILKTKGVKGVQDYLLREVQSVYRNQGVEINDKHIEIIVRQMLKKVKVEDIGDTNILPGELMDIFKFEEENEAALDKGGRPATAKRSLLGITKASLATDSFFAAASFQETARVLTEAAIKNKIDPLNGLKENVIIGKLIPAGTGMREYKSLTPILAAAGDKNGVKVFDEN